MNFLTQISTTCETQISSFASVDTKKKSLDIGTMYCSYQDIQDIGGFLAQISICRNWIQEITMSNNSYQNPLIQKSLQAISKCSKLKKLYMRNIFDQFITINSSSFSKSLLKLRNLQTLDLSENKLKAQSINFIADGLQNLTFLTQISLDGNFIDAEGALLISDAFQVSKAELQVFSIESNNIGNSGAYELSQMMRKMKSLKSINFSHNGISKVGIIAISRAVQVNPKIRQVLLRDNYINEPGAYFALRNALCCLSSLRVLNLGECSLGNSGVFQVLKGLKTRKLKEIHLQYNEICKRIVSQAIVKKMNKMPKLEYLGLTGNDVKFLRIRKMLQKDVILDRFQIGDPTQDFNFIQMLNSPRQETIYKYDLWIQ